MILESISSVIHVVLLVAMITSLWTWARQLYRCGGRVSECLATLFPARRRPRPFWTPADALLMFGLQIVCLAAIASLFGVLPPGGGGSGDSVGNTVAIEQLEQMTRADMIAKTAAMCATLAWLGLTHSGAWRDLGLIGDRNDGMLGLKASWLLLPPVLLVSAAVSRLVTYEHPVLDMLAALSSPLTLLLLFLATAIVTPVVEEFLFRVLLQGGLERVVDPAPSSSDQPWRPRSYWPILVTSLIFAILHFGQGAAPIPLFLLSLGLGYLYRRTGRITAPLIVHMVLNSITLVVEILGNAS